MSIATVITMGFGTASYADVNKLPTIGYSIGAAINLVNGPLIFPAAALYRPGAKAAGVYRPGAKAGEVSG